MSNAVEKEDFHTQKALPQLKLKYFTHSLYNNADSSLTLFFFFFFPPQTMEVALWSEAAFPSARFCIFQISQRMFSAPQTDEISLI